MRFEEKKPPRRFLVGNVETFFMSDCGTLALEPDEQVTLVTESGAEYDVARKDWGFYATPSLNSRLERFGLRAVLVKNPRGHYFVLLVERGREAGFERYLKSERLRVISWLDSGPCLDDVEQKLGGQDRGSPACPCGSGLYREAHRYLAPPGGEVRFPFSTGEYRRSLLRCEACGHLVSRHDMAMDRLYAADYVDATYGGPEGLRRHFERIVGLPADKSDNEGRVRRLLEFARGHFRGAAPGFVPRILDVGSGLCVFLHRLRREGWSCLALDPDQRAAEHARATAGVEAVCADFAAAPDLGSFDVICFNKMLEHVVEPAPLLAQSLPRLNPGGFVSVELPDGEAAAAEGYGREEFFIDHHHVFSMASLAILAGRAGFLVRTAQRLREPSGKYTLRAFLVPAQDPGGRR